MEKITLPCGCTYDKIDLKGGYATCNETYCETHQSERDAQQVAFQKNQRRNEIEQRLKEIDAETGSRAIREIMIADGKIGFNGKIKNLEDESAELRAELKTL